MCDYSISGAVCVQIFQITRFLETIETKEKQLLFPRNSKSLKQLGASETKKQKIRLKLLKAKWAMYKPYKSLYYCSRKVI